MRRGIILLSLMLLPVLACQSVTSIPGSVVPSQLPDLVITSVSLQVQYVSAGIPDCVASYGPYELHVTVENQGQAPAQNIAIQDVSTNQEIRFSGLEPGQGTELIFVASPPRGAYTLRVDPANEIAESNENNNERIYQAPTPTPPTVCGNLTPVAATPTAPATTNTALDGLIYADLSRAELWKVVAGGHPLRLMNGLYARFAPNGKAVFDQGGDLWLAEPMDQPGTPITDTHTREETNPQWWPSQPGIVVFNSWDIQEAQENHWTHETNSGYPSIIHTDGTEYRIIANAPSLTLPAPQPYGNNIAYDANGNPTIYEFGGQARALDVSQYGYQAPAGALFTSPSWSPDQRWLTWWVVEDLGQGNRRFSLLMLDLAEHTFSVLHTYTPTGWTEGWLANPEWSPDGQWIAYQTRGEATVWDLHLSRPNGGDAMVLRMATNPTWSPDSQHIAYVQWPPHSDSYLAAMLDVMDVPSFAISVPDLPPGSVPQAWLRAPLAPEPIYQIPLFSIPYSWKTWSNPNPPYELRYPPDAGVEAYPEKITINIPFRPETKMVQKSLRIETRVASAEECFKGDSWGGMVQINGVDFKYVEERYWSQNASGLTVLTNQYAAAKGGFCYRIWLDMAQRGDSLLPGPGYTDLSMDVLLDILSTLRIG